ncbi:hypothetical protein CSB45_03440 [candidate division KSB3 bacterium]|uniref:Metallo-beta-lactamase domain-containing protein n=1 Tax=candidate division KSB3 bacterium TaxID=2044937 RepID=A0A2G6E946_9BACT|nr:MAG: hypothetical protein CSB45_03440 [candidate division KSB3 bacterium]PIE29548.1 MAG: hypothetical protein CSA57_08035 [candidate division KSB3 bacterium]
MQHTLCFLGTGTSSGVPILGCRCPTCVSDDPRDARLRTSAYLCMADGSRIVIDVGPDFRQQALRHRIEHLDGILITHSHHDHIGGLDELRQLNFLMKREIDIYGNALTLREIQTRFNYIFNTTQEGGGKPRLALHQSEPGQAFSLKGWTVHPLAVMHGALPISGFQIEGLSYITDASSLPADTLERIRYTPLLVVNALRYAPHPTHFHLDQTLDLIREVQPERAYLVHMTHDIKHADAQRFLPPHVAFACDNLELQF